MTKLLLTELYPTGDHEILFENTARLLSKNFEVTCLTSSNSRVQPADRMPFECYRDTLPELIILFQASATVERLLPMTIGIKTNKH